MNRLNLINREFCSRKQKLFSMYIRCKSYYHTLGLDSTASAQDIKAAYYKLSLQYHPDKNQGSEESVAKFREISEAYETLSNADKKKKYDSGYSFHPEYSNTYERGNFGRARRSQSVHTGRTKDYDYDEHYRQHYDNIRRQQEIEFEYFKRRWEAEFYRRYPNREQYIRNQSRHMNNGNTEQFTKALDERRKGYLYLAAFWMFLMILAVTKEFKNPDLRDEKRTIYYHSSSHPDENNKTNAR